MRYPVQFDELSDVLDEIWATQGNSRRQQSGFIDKYGKKDLIGVSRQIVEIRSMIEQVAPSMATVLITGESGTGKEIIARQVHEQSGRKGPFVAINCSAIPDNLLESELFGHARGAFTGAVSSRAGRFELAEGGSIFLDEIGDMPSAMQVKLLRVLQERVIERVGDEGSIEVDIRVIAATHRDLQARIADGRFRADLFYRLSVFPIDVPPLRERPDDIPPLIEEMIGRVKKFHGISVELADDAIQLLSNYAWPGNVRELANLIERLAVIKPYGRLSVHELPWPFRQPPEVSDGPVSSTGSASPAVMDELPAEGLNLKEHLATVEQRLIRSALQEANNVVAKAAGLLGMGRTTLVEKMKRYKISI